MGGIQHHYQSSGIFEYLTEYATHLHLILFFRNEQVNQSQANQVLSDCRFFQGSHSHSNTSGASLALNRLFDRYRGKLLVHLAKIATKVVFPDNPVHEPDTIGVDGSMRYLGDIGVKLDEVVVLAVLTELSAPTMGELTREGFIEGWKTYQ